MTTKPYSTDETPQTEHVSKPFEEESNYPYYPSSGEELKQALAEAEDDFANGRVYSTDDLRKGIQIAMEQSRQGLGLTNEEMRNRKRPWRKS